ncbi:MAG TPA: lactate racemase domain-containing protein [Bryobacteraceae bacterium]|nr:lactate racemase domain-containing protein [Bryobacteraceae bacterium]
MTSPGVARGRQGAVSVREALRAPIGSPPLREIAKRARRIAVLVDDLSRPTPADTLLPEAIGRGTSHLGTTSRGGPGVSPGVIEPT